jgi:hypothetical protein
LRDYEKIKAGDFSVFKTVNELCEVYHIRRKDIRKYYKRWIKSGKDQPALLPLKRGPKPGKYKLLTKKEERIIIEIRRRLGANEFEIFHLLKNKFDLHPSSDFCQLV